MPKRLWHRLRVYYGFSEDPEEPARDGAGVGGIVGGAGMGMGAATLLGFQSTGAALAALLLGAVLGWGAFRIGRARVARR